MVREDLLREDLLLEDMLLEDMAALPQAQGIQSNSTNWTWPIWCDTMLCGERRCDALLDQGRRDDVSFARARGSLDGRFARRP